MRKLRRTSDAGGVSYSGPHLTDDSLLLWLDGELLQSGAAEVHAHLQACWACRGRCKRIEEGIAELVAYQDAVAHSYLPPPAHDRAMFLSRLQALTDEAGRPPRLQIWLTGVSRSLHLNGLSQFAWITTAIVLLSSLWLVYFLQTPTVVSADEVMSLSTANEVRSWQGTGDPVVVQKLRIRRGNDSMTHTVYRDIAHNRSTSQTIGKGRGQAELKAAYLRSSLDWNSLLTADSYAHLNETQRVGKHRVKRGGRATLTLAAAYIDGPISEADLIVRLPDYHPVEENIELSDHSEIEVAELSYDVVPFASVPAGIFPLVPQIEAPPLSVASVLRSPLLSNEELAASEVKVDAALHGLGADLGEQVDIKAVQGHGVIVEGVVADDERRRQLIAALRPLPHTSIHLVTLSEAAQHAASSPGKTAASMPDMQAIVAGPPLLKDGLDARFPDKDQRQAYVHQTLSLVQSASARAWALNRLANRYSIQGTASLDSDGRRQLQVLLTDHVAALREDLSSLQSLLGTVLSRSSNTPAANTSLNTLADPNSSGTPEHVDDWRIRSRRILSSVDAVQEAIAALLTSSQSSDESDAEAIEINLRTSLTQAQAELQILEQNLHKTSLK